MNDKQEVNVNISTLTILKIVLIIVVLGFIYLIRDVIGVVLVSFILASALTPTVDKMERQHRIPRVLSIIALYVGLFGIIALILVLLIPAIINQVGDIANNFPEYFSRVEQEVGNIRDFTLTSSFVDSLQTNLQSLRTDLGQATSGVLGTISSVFGGIFSFLGVIVITFYLIIEEQAMRRFLKTIVPPRYLPNVSPMLDKIQIKMGQWLRGQLVLSLSIFVVTFVGLSALGVKNALVLALFAGLMELVPFIGSTIGAIPAVFFGFTQALWLGFAVVGLYIVVQQLENNILVPKVMQKSVGLNPLIVIIGMLVGAKVAGIVGVLLAVPAILIFQVVFREMYHIYDEGDEVKKESKAKA